MKYREFQWHVRKARIRRHPGTGYVTLIYYFTDKGYFPSLQGLQPQMGYNINQLETELFNFSDTIEIKVLS